MGDTRIWLRTRGTSWDYRFLAESPDFDWEWNDLNRVINTAEASLVLKVRDDTWCLRVTGIPAARRDCVNTLIRYEIYAAGSMLATADAQAWIRLFRSVLLPPPEAVKHVGAYLDEVLEKTVDWDAKSPPRVDPCEEKNALMRTLVSLDGHSAPEGFEEFFAAAEEALCSARGEHCVIWLNDNYDNFGELERIWPTKKKIACDGRRLWQSAALSSTGTVGPEPQREAPPPEFSAGEEASMSAPPAAPPSDDGRSGREERSSEKTLGDAPSREVKDDPNLLAAFIIEGIKVGEKVSDEVFKNAQNAIPRLFER